MAATRVYVGAHYPHDVVAGLAVGVLVAWLGWVACGGLLTRLVDRLRSLGGGILRERPATSAHPG